SAPRAIARRTRNTQPGVGSTTTRRRPAVARRFWRSWWQSASIARARYIRKSGISGWMHREIRSLARARCRRHGLFRLVLMLWGYSALLSPSPRALYPILAAGMKIEREQVLSWRH